MITLTQSVDRDADFRIDGLAGDCYILHAATHPKYRDRVMKRAPRSEDYVVYIMQRCRVLKDHYTEADRLHLERMNALAPLKDGEVVLFNGAEYKVKILGNYSDAGRLIPVQKGE